MSQEFAGGVSSSALYRAWACQLAGLVRLRGSWLGEPLRLDSLHFHDWPSYRVLLSSVEPLSEAVFQSVLFHCLSLPASQ